MATLSTAVRQRAGTDFSALARRFSAADFSVDLPAPGIVTIKAPHGASRASVLVSGACTATKPGRSKSCRQVWRRNGRRFRPFSK
jgi:hypothetical protein